MGTGWKVLYAGSQGGALGRGEIGSFYGLDQVNVVLPHSLAGSGMIFPCRQYGQLVRQLRVCPWQMMTSDAVQIDIQ